MAAQWPASELLDWPRLYSGAQQLVIFARPANKPPVFSGLLGQFEADKLAPDKTFVAGSGNSAILLPQLPNESFIRLALIS